MPDDVENQRLDDALADYTDRLLEGALPPEEDLSQMPLPVTGEELIRLQQTVRRVQQAELDQRPSPAFLARLHNVLVVEYQRLQGGSRATKPPTQSFWQRWLGRLSVQPRGLGPRLALGTVAALILLVVLLPALGEDLPAASGIASLQPWIVLFLGVICAGLVVWLLRERH